VLLFLALFFFLLCLFIIQSLILTNLAFQLKFLQIYSTDDVKKTECLLALDGAKERLKLFKANLLEEGCFDSVVDGCQGVFHLASPVFFMANDPQVHPMILFLLL
jgi:hypothetical protein